MTEFTQLITDRDYKKAIRIHYFSSRFHYLLPVMGLIILPFVLVICFLHPPMIEKSITLIFVSVVCILWPFLYVWSAFRNIKSTKVYSNETHIRINEDNIVYTSNGSSSTIRLEDFTSYLNPDRFLFLYVAKNQFMLLDKTAMRERATAELIDRLEGLNVKSR